MDYSNSVKRLLEEWKSVKDLSDIYKYDDPYVFLADYYKIINDYAISVWKDIRFIFERGYSMDEYFEDRWFPLYNREDF